MTITGPVHDVVFDERSSRVRTWYRSKAPFAGDTRPRLPYHTVAVKKIVDVGPMKINSYNAPIWGHIWFGDGSAPTANRAYAKFIAALGERAEQAVNFAERRQAIEMMTARLVTLGNAARLLASGRALAASRQLALKYRGKPFVAAEDASKLWLEWHFGWSPLYGDIHASINILGHEFEPTVAEGKSSGAVSYVSGSYGLYDWFTTVALTWKAVVRGNVVVVNPMTATFAQLGLINPASVAWELVPFSFLVDWFVPVGAFLSQYTDLSGFTVTNPSTTIYCPDAMSNHTYREPSSVTIQGFSGHGMERISELGGVRMVWQPPRSLSVSRAATALSLAVTQLTQLGRRHNTTMSF